MSKLKNVLTQYLNENFGGIQLRKPLFYLWDIGLRFELGVGSTDFEEYFSGTLQHALSIFHSIFSEDEQVLIVFRDFKYRKQKIRKSNYLFKQYNSFNIEAIHFYKEKIKYFNDEPYQQCSTALYKTTLNTINIKNILTAISNTDFPYRYPRLDKKGVCSRKEVFFINLNKNIILNMYDDRGLDVIAANKNSLLDIYQRFNSWILDFDRKKIEQIFAD